MSRRPKVLVIVSHYLPGFKAGGPIRSIANLVGRLGQEFDFRVLTRDRDLGDTKAYSDVRTNAWQTIGLAQACYVPPTFTTAVQVARAVRRVRPDVIYFNSFFDASWCLSPLALMRFGEFAQSPVVIAPRGQFGAEALQFRPLKKKLYINAFKALGLARRIIWQATCEREGEDIHRLVGRDATVVVAPNISDVRPVRVYREPKRAGQLRLVYYSRVTSKKNLLGAIKCLHTLPGDVALDICGPVEDAAYEQRCRKEVEKLPKNIDVRWRGPLMPDSAGDILARYDALLLPTLGENFGHVIIEALAAGCPVVISDRTPWQGLKARAVGWDLPLDCPRAFHAALTTLSSMDERSHEQMRVRSIEYATAVAWASDAVEAHRRLFQMALGFKEEWRPSLSQRAA